MAEDIISKLNLEIQLEQQIRRIKEMPGLSAKIEAYLILIQRTTTLTEIDQIILNLAANDPKVSEQALQKLAEQNEEKQQEISERLAEVIEQAQQVMQEEIIEKGQEKSEQIQAEVEKATEQAIEKQKEIIEEQQEAATESIAPAQLPPENNEDPQAPEKSLDKMSPKEIVDTLLPKPGFGKNASKKAQEDEPVADPNS